LVFFLPVLETARRTFSADRRVSLAAASSYMPLLAAPSSYERIFGACTAGFDLLHGAAARAARAATTEVECIAACDAHGVTCVSASWWSAGRTTHENIRSQCWLSSSCTVPDCCTGGFRTHVKRRPHGGPGSPSPSPPPAPVCADGVCSSSRGAPPLVPPRVNIAIVQWTHTVRMQNALMLARQQVNNTRTRCPGLHDSFLGAR